LAILSCLSIAVSLAPALADDSQRLQQVESQLHDLQQQLDSLQPKEANPRDLHWYWDDGMRLANADKTFKLRWGGRIHNDWAFYSQNAALAASAGDMVNGTEFRRAEFYSEGFIYDSIEYKIEMEFAGGLAFEDVFIALKDLPIGTLRFGFDEEEFSMDELTSNKYITFMERSLPTVFKPGHSTGISIRNTLFDKRLRWTVGLFRDTAKFGESFGGKDFSVTGRISGLPVYACDGARLLHLGVAGNYRRPRHDTVRYAVRPESHLAKVMADTGVVAAERLRLADVELAAVLGPLSFQTEYTVAFVGRPGGGDARLSGYYVQVAYFLTGEHKPYDQSDAVFGRVHPLNDFGDGNCGIGAWEAAVRYSTVDLSDADITGGNLESVTIGLNWYLNPNTRIMFNEVFSNARGNFHGRLATTQMRIQVDF